MQLARMTYRVAPPPPSPIRTRAQILRASASERWRIAYSQSHQNDIGLRLLRESGPGPNALFAANKFQGDSIHLFPHGPIAKA